MEAWLRRSVLHRRRRAAIVDVLLDDGFPRHMGAVGNARQHQGFLDANKGALTVAPAFVQAHRTEASLLFGGCECRPRAAQTDEHPDQTAHRPDPHSRENPQLAARHAPAAPKISPKSPTGPPRVPCDISHTPIRIRPRIRLISLHRPRRERKGADRGAWQCMGQFSDGGDRRRPLRA